MSEGVMKRVKKFFVLMLLLIVPGTCFAQNMPLPVAQQIFSYGTIDHPVISANPAQAKPVGLGLLDSGGAVINAHVGIARFSGLVDIYIALYAPSLNPNDYYFLKPDGSFQWLSNGISPWKQNTTGLVDESPVVNLPTSALPPGLFTVYVIVVPAGASDLSASYIWETTFGNSLGIAEYFPLAEGDTWTYREEDGEFTTKIISGTESINGVNAVRMLDEDGDYMLWTNNDGIKWFKEFDADDIPGCGWEQINFSPPIGATGSVATVGTVFASSSTMTQTDCRGRSDNAALSYEFQIEGIEDVTVPAGTFKNCIKVRGNLTGVFSGSIVSSEMTIWLARGLGQIKSVNVSSNGTWTNDLVSANVGGVLYP